jgi:hypothetical protein
MANCDLPGHSPMLDREVLEAELRYEASRAGFDRPKGGCDLPEHDAMSLEEVLAFGARLEAEGAHEGGSDTVAVRGVRGTRKTRQDRGRGTGKAARGRPSVGTGVPRVSVADPPVKRTPTQRRGIRLGRDMPAPSVDGLGREEP